MVRNAVLLASLGCMLALTGGCSINAEEVDAEQSVDETQHQLWSFPFQGELTLGDIVKADLTGGDFGHFYAFEGTAGQTVTFVVEWREPESLGFGVDMYVEDASFNTIAQYWDYSETKAHLDVTFPADGTYYLTVGHNFWGWFGTYPYKVGAEPHMCSQVTLVTSEPGYQNGEIYATNNHEPGEGDPWTWSPDMSLGDVTEIGRSVWMGPCNGLIDDSCSASDPQVCGGTIVGGGLFDNACAFRTVVNYESGETSSGIGFHTEDLSCAE
jgi:Bacterial pre-peptidase C-terminal domain